MAGHVYEIVVQATMLGKAMANVFHVWDGAEDNTPSEIAANFIANYIADIAVVQVTEYIYNAISVTALDVGNGKDPHFEVISVPGSDIQENQPTHTHAYVKLLSQDNGFRSGGKMIGGLSDADVVDGALDTTTLSNIQTVYEDLIDDLDLLGVALAIYRPTLSTPGFPSISIVAAPQVRGIGSNNRRQLPFQN